MLIVIGAYYQFHKSFIREKNEYYIKQSQKYKIAITIDKTDCLCNI